MQTSPSVASTVDTPSPQPHRQYLEILETDVPRTINAKVAIVMVYLKRVANYPVVPPNAKMVVTPQTLIIMGGLIAWRIVKLNVVWVVSLNH